MTAPLHQHDQANTTVRLGGRPGTLAAVVAAGDSGRSLDAALREFLDAFYTAADGDQRSAMLGVPAPLTGDNRRDAYLGAVAEHLALHHALPVPPWSRASDRVLSDPWFPAGLESLKAHSLLASPHAFRSRMVFVSEGQLFRPRQAADAAARVGEPAAVPGGLSRATIIDALDDLDRRARAARVLIELAVYGGAAMALLFDAREATRDVDAVARGDPSILRSFLADIARERGWPADWLNDAVKGFLSDAEELVLLARYPGSEQGGVRVTAPTPRYLFAMKCMAMRLDAVDASTDRADILELARHADIPVADVALALIERFYPGRRIPPRVRFGVEELLGPCSAAP